MLKKFSVVFLIFFLLCNNTIAGKGYSSGGGRSYSSGSFSRPSFSSPSPRISSSPKISVSPKISSPSKSYSSSSNGYSSKPSSSYSSKPKGNFQSLSAIEQKKAESRVVYQKATTPKENYTTPKGNSVTINKDDKKVIQIRNISEEKWVTREAREHNVYNYYYSHPPTTIIHYNDPYNTFFWLWLLDRSIDERARWAYNHRYDMDDARYRDLLAKDKALEGRIRKLEAEKKQRDANYVPSGIDADLQYTDEYVDAIYNPEPKPFNWHWFWTFVKSCFCVVFCIFLIIALIYGCFYKDW